MSWMLFIAGALILTLFVYYEILLEKHGKAPLFSMYILRNRSFILGLLVVMSIYSTSSAFPLMVSILLQSGLGFTPLLAGMIFVPASLGFVISSLVTPYWITRYGERVVFWGAVLYGLSYVLLLVVFQILSLTSDILWLMSVLFLIGFTQGMIMTPMLNLVLSKVTSQVAGQASGLTATLQQVGAAAGTTVVSVILQYALVYFSHQLPFEQLKIAVSLGFGFSLLMAICAAILLLFITRKVKPLITTRCCRG
ncbi:MFS family permease [Providencia alcalifaciens]|nr:MFS family permease [Providencia alcalifaciens]